MRVVAPLVLKDPLRVFVDTASPADWKLTKLPDSVIQPGGSTTFSIRFQPTSAGLKTATVRIANSDVDEAALDFAIQGLGTSRFASMAGPAGVGNVWQGVDAALTAEWSWLAARLVEELQTGTREPRR